MRSRDQEGETDVPPGLAGVTAIAGGAFYSLALKSDGTVVAWGDDSNGQTEVPPDLSGVTAIAAGYMHALALKSDGTVVAWGDDSGGQTDVPPSLSGATAIAAGYTHSLALTESTVTDTCTDLAPDAEGSYHLTIHHFPPSESLSGFLLTKAADGTTTVANGVPITTDAAGSATSEAVAGPATHPTYNRRAVIFRDSNGNGRWDPGTDDTLFQGTATLAANTCQSVRYSPK